MCGCVATIVSTHPSRKTPPSTSRASAWRACKTRPYDHPLPELVHESAHADRSCLLPSRQRRSVAESVDLTTLHVQADDHVTWVGVRASGLGRLLCASPLW